MKVLLIGSGGREHALAWRLAQSDKCAELYCAPGNAGIAECAECVPIAADDIDGLTAFARKKKINLAIIGPEAPLVAGLADILRGEGIKVFGPSAMAAQIEGSKGFMKDLCAKYGVPTAAYARFSDQDRAERYIDKCNLPVVVKADGLAAGKGVVIAQTAAEAKRAVREMMSGIFGAAGREIIIEEFLEGEEVSFFALADGETYIPLSTAQDHKRVGDGDTGPNTGGMGAVSPSPIVDATLGLKIEKTIIEPVINAMAKEGCPFTGVLFAGLMIVKGEPYVLEFNARFGDPECQVLMMRLEGDALDILNACAIKRLEIVRNIITWRPEPAVCVVMAANGYPGPYDKGSVIAGIEAADAIPDTKVFHAATARAADGSLTAQGGRVLGVTALGPDAAAARRRAYQAVENISWAGGFCRRDIGQRAEQQEKLYLKKAV